MKLWSNLIVTDDLWWLKWSLTFIVHPPNIENKEQKLRQESWDVMKKYHGGSKEQWWILIKNK